MIDYLEAIKPFCKNVEQRRLELKEVINKDYSNVLDKFEEICLAKDRVECAESQLRAVMRFLSESEDSQKELSNGFMEG